MSSTADERRGLAGLCRTGAKDQPLPDRIFVWHLICGFLIALIVALHNAGALYRWLVKAIAFYSACSSARVLLRLDVRDGCGRPKVARGSAAILQRSVLELAPALANRLAPFRKHRTNVIADTDPYISWCVRERAPALPNGGKTNIASFARARFTTSPLNASFGAAFTDNCFWK
jgi:hypothetical protein